MPATFTELFLYVWARFSAPSRPCSSPAKAVKTIVLLGLYVAKIRASSRDTATPDALFMVSCLKLTKRQVAGKNELINSTWCVALEVNWIAIPRIVMATRNVYSVRVLAALQCCNHCGDVDRKYDALVVTRIFDEAVPVH
jgi:hypothetical protein